MLTSRDIIFISSLEWDFQWQGHQEIATRLARAGNRVLYVENMGVRMPRLRDKDRIVSRLKHWIAGSGACGVEEVEPNLRVCYPLVLPPFGPAWRRRFNRSLLLPTVARAVRELNFKDPIIWTYLPTDTAASLIEMLRTPRSLAVYYCIADFLHLTPYARQLRRSEQTVVEACDLIFAQCEELAEHCARWNENVHVFPFGVNTEGFAAAAQVASRLDGAGDGSTYDDYFGAISRPVIGYVGGLHRHVNFDLLKAMAQARPRWSWVYVGARQHSSADALTRLPNVHLFGQLPHPRLASCIRHFDVCIVPYRRAGYTETVVPTKINEYLAMGKPIVSTDLPQVCEFNRRHNVLCTTPGEAAHFLRAIEQALSRSDDPQEIARRREVAAQADWSRRLEAMCDLVERALAARSQSR